MGLILLLISFGFVSWCAAWRAGAPAPSRTHEPASSAVDRVWTGILWAIALFVVAILLAIIAYFMIASIGTLSPAFLVGDPSDTELGGIGPLLFNSLYILVLTLLITVPLGHPGGIYMAEYAGDRPAAERDPAQPGADQLASRRSSSACSAWRCS